MNSRDLWCFWEDGLYIKLHGPFPPQVMIEGIRFSSKYVMLDWLYREWPEWRKNIVMIDEERW